MEQPHLTGESANSPAEPVSLNSSSTSFRIYESASVYSLQQTTVTPSKSSDEKADDKERTDPYGNPISPTRSHFYNLPASSVPSSHNGSFYFDAYRTFDDPNLDDEQLEDK